MSAPMNNKYINQHLASWDEVRRDWIRILNENPGHSQACLHIININSKMDMLRSFWNWYDESVEMEIVR